MNITQYTVSTCLHADCTYCTYIPNTEISKHLPPTTEWWIITTDNNLFFLGALFKYLTLIPTKTESANYETKYSDITPNKESILVHSAE